MKDIHWPGAESCPTFGELPPTFTIMSIDVVIFHPNNENPHYICYIVIYIYTLYINPFYHHFSWINHVRSSPGPTFHGWGTSLKGHHWSTSNLEKDRQSPSSLPFLERSEKWDWRWLLKYLKFASNKSHVYHVYIRLSWSKYQALSGQRPYFLWLTQDWWPLMLINSHKVTYPCSFESWLP